MSIVIDNCGLQTPGALGTRKLGFGALPSTANFCHLKEVCGPLCDSAPPHVEGEGKELPSLQLCWAMDTRSLKALHEKKVHYARKDTSNSQESNGPCLVDSLYVEREVRIPEHPLCAYTCDLDLLLMLKHHCPHFRVGETKSAGIQQSTNWGFRCTLQSH